MIGLGIGIQFAKKIATALVGFVWGAVTSGKVWGTSTTETWG